MPSIAFLPLLLLLARPILSAHLQPRDGDPHASKLYLTSNTYSDDILSGPSNTPQVSETFVSDISRPADVPVDTTAFPSTSSATPTTFDLSFKGPTPVGPATESSPSDSASSTSIPVSSKYSTTHLPLITISGPTTTSRTTSTILGTTTSAIPPMSTGGSGQNMNLGGGGVKGLGIAAGMLMMVLEMIGL